MAASPTLHMLPVNVKKDYWMLPTDVLGPNKVKLLSLLYIFHNNFKLGSVKIMIGMFQGRPLT